MTGAGWTGVDLCVICSLKQAKMCEASTTMGQSPDTRYKTKQERPPGSKQLNTHVPGCTPDPLDKLPCSEAFAFRVPAASSIMFPQC